MNDNSDRLRQIIIGSLSKFRPLAKHDGILLLLIFITHIRLHHLLWLNLRISMISMSFVPLLLLIAIFGYWAIDGERPRGWERAGVFVGGFGLVCLVSSIFTIDLALSFHYMAMYVFGSILVFIITTMLKDAATLRRIIWALLATGIVMGTVTVLQQLTNSFNYDYWGLGQVEKGHIFGDTDNYRACGPIGDPNYYAQFLLVLVPLAFDRLWTERQLLPIIFSAWALVTCVLSIVFTFSRGGFLGLLVVFVFLALRVVLRPPPLWKLLSTVVLVIVLFKFLTPQYVNRVQTLIRFVSTSYYILISEFHPSKKSLSERSQFEEKPPKRADTGEIKTGKRDIIDDLLKDHGFRGRLSENIVAWQIFMDHPVLGIGFGNYEAYYQRYSQPLGIDSRRTTRKPHNLFLEVAAETGIVGLTVFIMMLSMMLIGMVRARKYLEKAGLSNKAGLVEAYIISMIGYLTTAIFLDAAFIHNFLMLTGIAFAIPNVAEFEVITARKL